MINPDNKFHLTVFSEGQSAPYINEEKMYGESVIIPAETVPGKVFDHWSDNNMLTSEPRIVTVWENTSLMAFYREKE